MIVSITLVLPDGGDAGPFDLYSNIDGYSIAFEMNVPILDLINGYTSNLVPEGTTIIRVMSTGRCTNYIDIPINLIPTTTTTSSTSTTTSTSTSSTSSTTSTSTTAIPTTTSTSTSTTSTTSSSTSTTTSTTTRPIIGGALVIENNATRASVDDTYAVSWVTLIGLPAAPGQTITGIQTGTTHAISVDITVETNIDRCLTLYVNNILVVGGIATGVSGTYVFDATPILPSDEVRIVFSNGACP